MNELYPALLSTPMVQAHKAGRKTETRRLNGLGVINNITPDCWTFEGFEDGKAKFISIYPSINPCFVKMPYGNVGNFIWFRETWQERSEPLIKMGFEKYYYKADWQGCTDAGWKSSLYMPLSAARFFGLVKEVRIERLNDITEVSAIDEGIEKIGNRYNNYSGKISFMSAITSYQSLWMSLNGDDSWDVNPWVWVYKYEPKTRAEVEALLGELKPKIQIKKRCIDDLPF